MNHAVEAVSKDSSTECSLRIKAGRGRIRCERGISRIAPTHQIGSRIIGGVFGSEDRALIVGNRTTNRTVPTRNQFRNQESAASAVADLPELSTIVPGKNGFALGSVRFLHASGAKIAGVGCSAIGIGSVLITRGFGERMVGGRIRRTTQFAYFRRHQRMTALVEMQVCRPRIPFPIRVLGGRILLEVGKEPRNPSPLWDSGLSQARLI